MCGAGASDDESSSSATSADRPSSRPSPVIDRSDGTEPPAAPSATADTTSGTEAPAATEAASAAAPVAAPADTASGANDSGAKGYADETLPTFPPIDAATETASDAQSTFAMDVDTGSYTYATESLHNGVIPDPAEVRTEEFVNAFEQDYAPPIDGTFRVTMDGTSAPFLAPDTRVLRVGIQGRVIADEDRRDANLTFVIDISGSMADEGKLDTVKPALARLVDALRPSDRVAIVVYSNDTRVVLASTKVRERDAILEAIDELEPEGSTNVQEGLTLGYAQARSTLDPDRINRVVLLSDGVANVGATGPDEILGLIEDSARSGIDLVTVGFGFGDYNDDLMEQLADQGDGFYAYVNGEDEATRLFTDDLTGTLQTIARDAKVQVTFNPDTVRSYRLIGFENRAVADTDFRDDSVDGGEVGAGHTVTALYEVSLAEGASDGDWLARTDIRWLDPDTHEPDETSATLLGNDVVTHLGDASLRLQQDVYVAAFAEYLHGGPWSSAVSLGGLTANLHSLAERLDDSELDDLASLIDQRLELD